MQRIHRTPILCALLLCAALLAGCRNDKKAEPAPSSTPAMAPLALAGSFTEATGAVDGIVDRTWARGSNDGTTGFTEIYHVMDEVKYPYAAAGYLIAQNDAANPSDGGFYSVFDWIAPAGNLYVCHTASNLSALGDAAAMPVPDSSTPTVSGCGGAPWTQLFRQRLPVQGQFTDNYGGRQTVTQTLWDDGYGKYHIVAWDPAQSFLIARNDTANTYSPDLYSRIDWTQSGGNLYSCFAAFDAATPALASSAAAPDASMPDTGGCGGFSWTRLGSPVNVYASRVLASAPLIPSGVTAAQWPYFFQPDAILGPPGDYTNVVSLGYNALARSAQGGSITIGLGTGGSGSQRSCIVDEAGSDFIVLENPFATTDPGSGIPGTSNEIATAEVSSDGATWYEFLPDIDFTKNAVDPTRYTNFAGVQVAGDLFDLAAVIAANPGTLDATFKACYVRLTDGGTRYPDYGNTQSDLYSSGADINSLQATHFETVPGIQP